MYAEATDIYDSVQVKELKEIGVNFLGGILICTNIVMFLILMSVGYFFMFLGMKLLFLRMKNVVVGKTSKKDWSFLAAKIDGSELLITPLVIGKFHKSR